MMNGKKQGIESLSVIVAEKDILLTVFARSVEPAQFQ